MNMTPNDVLRSASDIMDRRGKTEGKAYDPNTGQVCTYGAIEMALHGEETFIASYMGEGEGCCTIYDAYNSVLFNDAVTKLENHIDRLIPNWSDETDETTVIATLRDLSKED